MQFPERVQWCREHTDVLDRDGWAHLIGPPLERSPLSWYPESLARVQRLCDGLTTRLLWFHPYEELVKGLSETRRTEELRLGIICYSFPVRLDVATEELSIWDGDDLMFADEDDDEDELEPVFTTRDPFGFFDEYVFGPKYPELIDRVIGFESAAAPDQTDEWRDLLGRIT